MREYICINCKRKNGFRTNEKEPLCARCEKSGIKTKTVEVKAKPKKDK